MSVIKAYTDGACRGNPGPGGAGVVIYYPENTSEISEFVGRKTTNNVAEYTAVVLALEHIKNRGVTENEKIVIYTDSDLIVKQITGVWKCNKEHIRKLKEKAQNILRELNVAWSFIWVKGHAGNEGNERADQLANLAIDARLKGTR